MAKETNAPTGTSVANTTTNSEALEVENVSASESSETTTMAELKGIRYTGGATARHITADDFKGVGVTAKGDLTWDASNGYVVPADDINAATRDYLVKDGEFEVVK